METDDQPDARPPAGVVTRYIDTKQLIAQAGLEAWRCQALLGGGGIPLEAGATGAAARFEILSLRQAIALVLAHCLHERGVPMARIRFVTMAFDGGLGTLLDSFGIAENGQAIARSCRAPGDWVLLLAGDWLALVPGVVASGWPREGLWLERASGTPAPLPTAEASQEIIVVGLRAVLASVAPTSTVRRTPRRAAAS